VVRHHELRSRLSVNLEIPAARLEELAPRLRELTPWNHKYRLAADAYVGYFKHHGIADTVALPGDPAVPAMAAAYSDYLDGRPFALLEELIARTRTGTVLDIASSTGRHGFYLAQRGYTVRGVEIRPEQVQQAYLLHAESPRLRGLPVSFEHEPMSADDPAFREGETYDVVLSLGLLYHLANPVQHIRNLRRLTRCVAVVETQAHWAMPRMWELTLEQPERMTKAAQGISWRPYYGEVTRLLRAAGFESVEIVPHPLVWEVQAPFLRGRGRIGHELRRARASRRARRRQDWFLRRYVNPSYFSYIARG
jgi:SAM-dependent methyltransferase